jgi:tetratricopeptide (TPR) repeat protein
MRETNGAAATAAGPRELQAPLLGRAQELSVLRRAAEGSWRDATPRVVTLLGASGIGKSRIVQDFLAELEGEGTFRVYRSRAPNMALSYGLFQRLLRARFGVAEGADSYAAREQVRTQVAEVLDDRKVGDVCYFLGQLMDLPFLDSPLTRAVADDAIQARLLRRAIVRSFFEADAARGPICLLLEDLQSADGDSIELLRYLIENLYGPILLLATTRPEFLTRHEDWFEFGRGRHERLELGPVSEDHSLAIMGALLSACVGGPPDALLDAGVGMAGGNPGLLERMVRIFQDSGVLEQSATLDNSAWKVNLTKLASVRLPLTPEDAVAARIATLASSERRVLEHAAAMGSVFWLGGLVALTRMDREPPELWSDDAAQDVDEVRRTLSELVHRDYLLELPDSAFADETEYVFRHNLEREKIAALTSAAASRRYHQTVADWLSQKEGVRSQEEYCAMLAQHLERAGCLTRAGLTYLEAGDIARQSYAAKKAHEYYSRGLELLRDDDARRCIDALHNHGDVLLLLGKTDEALAAFREMLGLAFRLGIKSKGGAAHNRIGRVYRDIGLLAEARQHLDTGLTLFREVRDERGVAASHDDVGKLLWIRGEYDSALEHMRTSLEMRKKIGDRRSIALSLNNIGTVWMDHGRAKKAQEALEASLAIRREINDPLGVVQSLNNLGRLAQDQGNHRRALELFKEAYQIAEEIGERNRIAVVLTNIGEANYRLGNTAEAIRILKEAEELCDELGDKIHLAEAKRGLAKAYLMHGDLRRARESIKHAVDLFGQVRSKVHLAIALRTLGEITAAGAWGEGHEVRAVDYFMRSIAIFREISNELEVARSYRAFASYVSQSPHYKNNDQIQREARKLSTMADEIFERHRIIRSENTAG